MKKKLGQICQVLNVLETVSLPRILTHVPIDLHEYSDIASMK